MTGSRGSVLTLVLFAALAITILTRLTADVAVAQIERLRGQTAADFSLLSALRVRAQALAAIGERWQVFGPAIEWSGGRLTVDPARWLEVSAAADQLRRSLSGFQGRISSALTVAAEANGADRDWITVDTPDVLRLDVETQTETVLVGPAEAPLPGAWYRRRWRTDEAAPPSAGTARIRLDRSAAWSGGTWPFRVASAADLAWDASLEGNGGFAPSAAAAVVDGAFQPHRLPFYRPALAEDAP